MAIGLTTKEVSEHLEIPASTLKTWIKSVPVPTTFDSLGNRRFGPEAVDIVKAIKQMRIEGCGFQTITRRIGLETTPRPSQDEPAPTPGPSIDELKTSEGSAQDNKALVAQIILAIREENDLAEKYGRVAHQMGKLEERVEYLNRENTNLQSELTRAQRLLTDGGKESEELRRRLAEEGQMREATVQQLAVEQDLRQKAEARLAEHEAQQAQPWWRRVFRLIPN